MATSVNFIEYVMEQVPNNFRKRNRKMFGEYMVYINDKPILLVCDDTVFVKMKDEIKDIMEDEETGVPYNGAREHYILPIENGDIVNKVISILEPITPLPKKKIKKE